MPGPPPAEHGQDPRGVDVHGGEERPRSVAEQMAEQGIEPGMGGLQPGLARKRGGHSRDEVLPPGSQHGRGPWGDEFPG